MGVILGAMQQHPQSKEVQEYGCWAINNMANEVAQELKEAGADKEIEAAMKPFPNVANIQKMGAVALERIQK